MTFMKKLTAYQLDVEINGIGYAKLDPIINEITEGKGNIIDSYWIGGLACFRFTYKGYKTKNKLLEDLTQKMQAESIQGKITEFKEASVGRLAEPKYAPRLKVTKIDDEKKSDN